MDRSLSMVGSLPFMEECKGGRGRRGWGGHELLEASRWQLAREEGNEGVCGVGRDECDRLLVRKEKEDA